MRLEQVIGGGTLNSEHAFGHGEVVTWRIWTRQGTLTRESCVGSQRAGCWAGAVASQASQAWDLILSGLSPW